MWNVFRLWCLDLCCIICLRSAVATRRGWDCSFSLHHIATVFHFYWECLKLKENASRNKRLCLFLIWQLFLSFKWANPIAMIQYYSSLGLINLVFIFDQLFNLLYRVVFHILNCLYFPRKRRLKNCSSTNIFFVWICL